MSPLEKFGALERKAEDPFRTLAEGSASTSAWILAALSLGDAAQRGWRGGTGLLGVAGSGRATPSHLR